MSATFESARLEALVEAARLLQSATTAGDLLLHLLRSSMGQVLARRGFVAFQSGEEILVCNVRGIPAELCGNSYAEERCRQAGIDSILPIGDPAAPMGYLGLGGTPAVITAEQENFLGALMAISAGALENVRGGEQVARLNRALDRKVHDLRTLLELVRNLTAVVEPEQVAHMLGLTLAGQWLIQRYAVAAWKDGQPDVLRARGIKAGLPLLRRAAEAAPEPLAVESLTDPQLREDLVSARIAVVVPLFIGETLVGIVALGSRPSEAGYSPDDLEYTRGLADQAAVAFENAWHFLETLEKKKIEKELELAADIQRRLLPSAIPQSAGYEVAARTRPARHVGGDYYDAIPLPDGQILYCVADVSGKGIAASLLMSNFQASLRAFASSNVPLADTVTRMNTLMHASTAANKFVTAIFTRIDPVSGRCGVVNAGHNDGIILRSDGSVDLLKAGGLAVGLMPGRTYSEVEWQLGERDIIALYSDGVTEANDPHEEELGIDRLIAVLRASAEQPAGEIVQSIYTAVDAFAGAAPQYDDITVMIVRRS